MPQTEPQFQSLAETIDWMWGQFSASAPERFERYLTLSENRQLEAMAKVRWNTELSEALIPCLQAAELTLRNSIHRAMAQKYPATNDWWFDAQTSTGPLLTGRDHDKVEAARRKIIDGGRVVNTPRVVAELTFGFWVELLNPEYEVNVVRPLLGSTMRKLKTGNRTQGWMRETFGKFRDLRNRVMHHELIYTNGELQHLNHLAWQIVGEVDPWQAHVLRPACRFDAVWSQGWNESQQSLRKTARALFKRLGPSS